jgi:hypothetical protein
LAVGTQPDAALALVLPAAQRVHCVEPRNCENVPAAHGLQDVAAAAGEW